VKYRTLGRTGLKVSEVGFGGGGIGNVWGATTSEESRRAIRRALELGVNFFDVAPGYGRGGAEELVGEGVRAQRDKVFIETKVSLRPDCFDDIHRHVVETLEGSLRRLQTDYVDVLLIHNAISSRRGVPYPGAITADDALAMADAFKELQQEGKARFIGFTAWRCNRGELAKLVDSGVFDVLQTEYNILNQSSHEQPPPGVDIVRVEELERKREVSYLGLRYQPVDQYLTIPQAVAYNMGVVCLRPVLAGVLTDAIDRPMEPLPFMEKMLERAKNLEFLKRGGKRTLSEAAFIFCLMNEGISTIVPGVKNAAEIEEAARCSGAELLTPEELRRIDELYCQNFGVP